MKEFDNLYIMVDNVYLNNNYNFYEAKIKDILNVLINDEVLDIILVYIL